MERFEVKVSSSREDETSADRFQLQTDTSGTLTSAEMGDERTPQLSPLTDNEGSPR